MNAQVHYHCRMSIEISFVQKEYLLWRAGQGYSLHTTSNDKTAFMVMNRVLGAHADIAAITQDSVHRILGIAAETRSPASVNNIHASLSGFFKWGRMVKYLTPDNDPLLGLRYRKVPTQESTRIPLSDFPLLLDSADNPRDRILVATGLYLFLRTSEVEPLRIRDLKLDEGTISATIYKTGDHDVMPISSEYDKELRRWLTHYAASCGELKPHWYLIPAKLRGNNKEREAYAPEVKISHTERHIERTLTNMGWDKGTSRIGMHLLRKSGARAWFDELNNQTVDGALKIVQAHLHHKSVVMTERYLGLTADRVKRDRILRGESMFPSLTGENVIHLRKSG